jgi:hypothetical protein
VELLQATHAAVWFNVHSVPRMHGGIMSDQQPDPFSPHFSDYAQSDDVLESHLQEGAALAYARSVSSMALELASAVRERLLSRDEIPPDHLDDAVCAYFVSDMFKSLKEDEFQQQENGDSEGSIELRALGCRILMEQLDQRLKGQEETLDATMAQIGPHLASLIQEPGLMERLSTNAIRKLPRVDPEAPRSTFHPTPQIPGGD